MFTEAGALAFFSVPVSARECLDFKVWLGYMKIFFMSLSLIISKIEPAKENPFQGGNYGFAYL